MKYILTLSSTFLFITLSSCSSKQTYGPNNSTYKTTTYQSYSVTPYEDEFVKIENTSTDFRNRTGEKGV